MAAMASSLPAAAASPPLEPLPVRTASGLVRRAAGALVGRRARLAGTVYLLLDVSASMADPGKMPELRRGAVRFFYEAWRRDYAVGVIAFAAGARVRTGATRDPYRFQRCLADLMPNGGTAMAAALRLASGRLRGRRGERLALVITDGMPDDPRAAIDAARAARALGITVTAVGTGNADQDFLRALSLQPELAETVELGGFAASIGRAADRLRRG